MSAPLPAGAVRRISSQDPWEPWTPSEVARLLAGVPARWYVAGGWSVELFLAAHGVTGVRAHEDLEIAVAAADFPLLLPRFAGHQVLVAGDGHGWPLDSPAFHEHHQTWVSDPGGVFRLDVFREPHDAGTWICRRDPALRLPYARLVRHDHDGVPYGSPEVALLFKAKYVRDKDQQDLEAAVPLLEPDRLSWLRDALRRVHPGHPWLGLLTSGDGAILR